MAQPAPRTWVDGERPSGVQFNREIRDQLRASMLHLASQRGQMGYSTRSRELAMLDPPTAASVLTHPSGSNPPAWTAVAGNVPGLIADGTLEARMWGTGEVLMAIAANSIQAQHIAAGAAIENIGAGGIGTLHLADGAATAPKLADGAVLANLTGTGSLDETSFNAALRNRLNLDPARFFTLVAGRERSIEFRSSPQQSQNIQVGIAPDFDRRVRYQSVRANNTIWDTRWTGADSFQGWIVVRPYGDAPIQQVWRDATTINGLSIKGTNFGYLDSQGSQVDPVFYNVMITFYVDSNTARVAGVISIESTNGNPVRTRLDFDIPPIEAVRSEVIPIDYPVRNGYRLGLDTSTDPPTPRWETA